jgi:hypothetical protein
MAATEGQNSVTEAEMEKIRQEQEVAAAAQPTEQTEIAFEENNPASANNPNKS